jgi:hypothetical protein
MTHKVEKIPHYEFYISTCEECKISNHGSMKYLDLLLRHDTNVTQFSPPINLVDTHTVEKYLCDTFSLSNIGELKGKQVWSIAGFSEVFALINPLNNKMFNLKSFYLADNFKDDIEEYKKLDDYKNVNLDNAGMINFIALSESIKKINQEDPNLKAIYDDIKKYLLFVNLDSSLDDKAEFMPKMKI